MRELDDDAIVLRTYSSGEADRVVVLWTRAHGKVRVIAKGVRKTTSRLGGTLEVLGYVRVSLVRTRGDFYIARHVSHLERFATLRSSYERITAGFAVVEMVDAIPVDDVVDDAFFEVLVRVLGALDNPEYDPTLVPASFGLRLLDYDGSAPVLDACANCGREGPLVAFDAAIGGALCSQCRSGSPLSPEALSLMRRIVGGDLAAVLRSAPAASGEVSSLVHQALEVHLGRRLRAARSTAPLGPRNP
ncbi:MAG: DNA repair protein RecO [Acidobacteriota bacterium]|nr:DNA repair protein RecO [Acidobacteriota bacterium]